jgi:hypothetical protein
MDPVKEESSEKSSNSLQTQCERASKLYEQTFAIWQNQKDIMSAAWKVINEQEVDKEADSYKELTKFCNVDDGEAVVKAFQRIAGGQRTVFRNLLADERTYLQLDISVLEVEIQSNPTTVKDTRAETIQRHKERLDYISRQLEWTSSAEHDAQIEAERDIRLEQFIVNGLHLIRSGKYSDAITHFRNEQFYRSVDLLFRRGKIYPITQTPTSQEASEIANVIAQLSEYQLSKKGAITVANFQVYPQIENPPEGITIPEELQHNTALVHAEEAIHALDHMRGVESAVDMEIGVAKYFQKHQVKMTDEFLNRYDRRNALRYPS